MKRSAFFISDRTGITAETLGHSLLSQFEVVDFRRISLRFIDNPDKAKNAVSEITDACRDIDSRPLVFSTLVDAGLRMTVSSAPCVFFDLFETFIKPMEEALGVKSSGETGRSHGVKDSPGYDRRIQAVEFALQHDDGMVDKGYQNADMILLGVSRSGKTPTCLYLALRYGQFAANYPLTEEDLAQEALPQCLEPYKHKLFGLTIDPDRLVKIRKERRPDGKYSTYKQCRVEIGRAEDLYANHKIPFVNTTSISVEEIATSILSRVKYKALAEPGREMT